MSKPLIPNPTVHNAGNLPREYQIPFSFRNKNGHDSGVYQFAARIRFNSDTHPQQALKLAEILNAGGIFGYHCVFLNGQAGPIQRSTRQHCGWAWSGGEFERNAAFL
jgi:hypothetical protein